MLVIKELIFPIDLQSISFPTMEVSGDQQLFFSSKILQNIFFYVQHKKETYTGLEGHEGE